MRRFSIAAAIVFVLLVTNPINSAAERLIVVAGLDETGSYHLRQHGVRLLTRLIAQLKPGDILYLRQVTDNSYLDKYGVYRLEIPSVKNRPTNKFDKRARAAYLRSIRANRLAKAEAIQRLKSLKPVKASKTDLRSFFAAAADRFKYEKRAETRLMAFLVSDMEENRLRKVEPNLLGAEVVVASFQSGNDPARSRRLKKAWARLLTKVYKAGSVRFIPADVSFELNHNESDHD